MGNILNSFRAIYDFYIELANGRWYDSFQSLQHFIFLVIFIIWIIKPSRLLVKTFSIYFLLTFLGVCSAMLQIGYYSFAVIFFLLFLIFLYEAINKKTEYKFSFKYWYFLFFLVIGLWYPLYNNNFFISPYGLFPQPTLLVILSVMSLIDSKINKISAISVALFGLFFGIFGFFYLKIFYDVFLIILPVIFFLLKIM
jgi:hypothetical protein